MTFAYGKRSEANLAGIHPDMDRLFRLVIQRTPVDITILEGLRDKTRQARLLEAGKTWTLNSRHITGHAVDVAPIVNGEIPWNDPHPWVALSKVVFECADELGILIQWGGDWDLDGEWRDESKFDGPHYQMPWPYRRVAAIAAASRREMLAASTKGELAVVSNTEVSELSPDITPGLKPEDMKDEAFASEDVGGVVVEPPKKARKKAKKKAAKK